MLERIIGVITLKAQVYREIADDQNATNQAIIIFILANLVAGFFGGLVSIDEGAASISLLGAILGAIVKVVIGLVGLFFTGWVLAFVAKLLEGKTTTSEMVRVTGYVSVFGLVAVLNILTAISPALLCLTGLISFVVAILSLIGYTIGVREAAEFTTGKAIITAIVAAVVNFVIVTVIAGAVITAIVAALAIAN